jgi:hypothetical protein
LYTTWHITAQGVREAAYRFVPNRKYPMESV